MFCAALTAISAAERIRPCRCGNAQAVANEQQIIIAADVTDQANDVRQTVPMTNQAIDNLDAAGVTKDIGAFTADTGYFSEESMNALDAHERVDDVFIATGRQKHNDKVADSPKGRPPKNLTAKQKMARRNRTKKGRAEYARRKVIIVPNSAILQRIAVQHVTALNHAFARSYGFSAVVRCGQG
jgi:hypothetical protein